MAGMEFQWRQIVEPLLCLCVMMIFPLPSISLPHDMGVPHVLQNKVLHPSYVPAPHVFQHIQRDLSVIADFTGGAKTLHKCQLLVGRSISIPDLHKHLPYGNFSTPSLSKERSWKEQQQSLSFPSSHQMSNSMLFSCEKTGLQQQTEAIGCVTSVEEMEEFARSRLGSCNMALGKEGRWLEASSVESGEKTMTIREVRQLGSEKSETSVVCEEVILGIWICREMEGVERIEVKVQSRGKEGNGGEDHQIDLVLQVQCYKGRKTVRGGEHDENGRCEWVKEGTVVWVRKTLEQQQPQEEQWMNEKHHHHHHHGYENGNFEDKHETKVNLFHLVKFKKEHRRMSGDGENRSSSSSNRNKQVEGEGSEGKSMTSESSAGASSPPGGNGGMDQSMDSGAGPGMEQAGQNSAAGGAGSSPAGGGGTGG